MKYIIVIILAVGGFYAYKNHTKQDLIADNYPTLLKKVETTAVTLEEVKLGINKLAETFCNDPDYQRTGGSSVSACNDKLSNYREMCESRIFANAADTFTLGIR